MGITKELNRIQKETLRAQASVKERIEFWKTHTLAESLYNDGKTPRPQDIAQISTKKFDSYGFENCYLLANLINIARTKPKLITNGMIKIKSDNEVELRFFEVVPAFDRGFKDSVDKGLPVVLSYESTKKHTYSVKKEEILKLISETHHKALWPLIIEIGYAKHILKVHKTLNPQTYLEYLCREIIDTNKEELDLLRDQAIISILLAAQDTLLDSAHAARFLANEAYKYGGKTAITYTELTGIKSESIILTATELFSKLKKFSKNAKYASDAEEIYKKIETKLKQKRDIVVAFKGFEKRVDQRTTASGMLAYLKHTPFEEIVTYLRLFFKKTPQQWLLDNKDKYKNRYEEYSDVLYTSHKSGGSISYPPSLLQLLSDEELLQYINDCLDIQKYNKYLNTIKSKTKKGLINNHGYAVVGCLEHEGYKYIVLQNPQDVVTKIDYSKSKKLPPEVKLPTEIDGKITSRNQCMMELNHFCKHLSEISYN